MSLTPHELRSIAEEVVTTRKRLGSAHASLGLRQAEHEVARSLRARVRRGRLDLDVEAERVRFLAVVVAMGRELDRLVLAERAARAERRDDENGSAR